MTDDTSTTLQAQANQSPSYNSSSSSSVSLASSTLRSECNGLSSSSASVSSSASSYSPSSAPAPEPTPLWTIPQVLDGTTILVTGGAGFVGTALLFRLLCDPELKGIKKVIALIRGETVDDAVARLPDVLRACTKTSKDDQGNDRHPKLVVVNGDCGTTGFALQGPQRDIVDQADIVIHTAGDTRFTLPLSKAVASITDLAYVSSQFSLLSYRVKTHIHLSTTFVAWFVPSAAIVQEQLVQPGLDERVDTHDSHVNTYFHAKTLAEACVDALARPQAGRRPHGKAFRILRLSTIGPAVEFPRKGWGAGHPSSPLCAAIAAEPVEDWSLIAHGAGLDVIPIDVAVNQIVALTASAHSSHKLPSTHVTHPRNPLNPLNLHGSNVPTYHIAAGLQPGSNIPMTLLNQVDVKLSEPYVPWKNLLKVYQPFISKLVAFDTARARRALGMKEILERRPFDVDLSPLTLADDDASSDQGGLTKCRETDPAAFGIPPSPDWSDAAVDCTGFEVDVCKSVERRWGATDGMRGWKGYIEMVRDEMERRGPRAEWSSFVD